MRGESKDEQIKRLQCRVGQLEATLRTHEINIPKSYHGGELLLRWYDMYLSKSETWRPTAITKLLAEEMGLNAQTVRKKLGKEAFKNVPVDDWTDWKRLGKKWVRHCQENENLVLASIIFRGICLGCVRSGVWRLLPLSIREHCEASRLLRRKLTLVDRKSQREYRLENIRAEKRLREAEEIAWKRFEELGPDEQLFCQTANSNGLRRPGFFGSFGCKFSMVEFMDSWDRGCRVIKRGNDLILRSPTQH